MAIEKTCLELKSADTLVAFFQEEHQADLFKKINDLVQSVADVSWCIVVLGSGWVWCVYVVYMKGFFWAFKYN